MGINFLDHYYITSKRMFRSKMALPASNRLLKRGLIPFGPVTSTPARFCTSRYDGFAPHGGRLSCRSTALVFTHSFARAHCWGMAGYTYETFMKMTARFCFK